MIVQLTGTLVHKEPHHCIVNVGGVGYGVQISLTMFGTLPEEGAEMSLPIYTYVREDQLQLFGFSSKQERHLFQKLISISGVGPKIAMAVLSGLPPPELIQAITTGDANRLSTIPGIGKKTAQRMIVELRDSIARDATSTTGQVPNIQNSLHEDALSALTNLGYPKALAEKTLQTSAITPEMRLEEVIRTVLKELCKA